MEPYNIHTLANGATICVISCSDLKFSDGTRSKGQSQKFCDQFKFRKEFCGKDIIVKGMRINSKYYLRNEHDYLNILSTISKNVDIVLVDVTILKALDFEKTWQDKFDKLYNFENVVSFQEEDLVLWSGSSDFEAGNGYVVDIDEWYVM